MNKRQIESRIKNETNQIEVPDLRSQILAQVPNRKIKEPKKTSGFSLAFRLSPILAVLIICLLIIIGINQQPGENIDDEPTNEIITTNVSKVKKAYARQAATVAGFADTLNTDVANTSSILLLSDETDYQSIAEKINEYFNAVSKLIDEENVIYVLEELSSGNYQYKLTIKSNVLNDYVETVMYYNEKAIDNKRDKDDLDEISTQLDGYIEQNGNNYPFYGSKEVEEDECEIEIVIKVGLDNYLRVSQEIEQHESEYEYEFYDGYPKNNEPHKKVTIEIETDKNDENKKDVKVEVDEDGEEFEMNFTYKKGQDKDHVDVNYHKGEEQYDDIKIHDHEEKDDYYRYEFGEGNNHNVEKNKGKDKSEDKKSEDGKTDDRPHQHNRY